MIDANGKKIDLQEGPTDIDFLKCEIRFIMKSFRKDQTDVKATTISSKLVEGLKESAEVDYFTEILTELESYAPSTDSEDFLWDLIYARRTLAKKLPESKNGLLAAANHYRISAEHFSHVVRTRPTTFNRCAEVLEWLSVTTYYNKLLIHDRIKVNNLLYHARELYDSIEEDESLELYYRTGEQLYLWLILHHTELAKDKPARTQVYLKMTHFSRWLYLNKHSLDSLRQIGRNYIDCLKAELFSYKDEQSNIDKTIQWLETEMASGRSVGTILKKLKALLPKT